MASGKMSARQRMINMMYLVLMALLALNVSREILRSFHDMSVSFHKSQEKIEAKIDGQIKALAKQASDDHSLQPYLDRVNKADQIVDDFIKHLDEIEDKLVADTDGREEDEENPVEHEWEKPIKGPDNIEKHAFYFVKDSDNKKEEEGFRGKALEKRINDTRQALIDLLIQDTAAGVEIPAGKMDEIDKASALRASLDKKSKYKSWAAQKLEHAPLGAVVALFAQMRNDARTTQAAVTDVLARGKESVFVIKDLIPVVHANSNVVMSGEEYSAEVFLAATTKNAENVSFELTKGGSTDLLKREGDKAVYTIRPTSQGTVQWGGVITVQTKKGPKEYPFESEYQVFQGNASIAATKMNVLYIGVKNPISVAVPGVDPSKVRVSMSGGSIVRKGKNYEATVKKTGKATITVVATMQDGTNRRMGSQEYKVRKLPKPIAKWGTLGSGLPAPKPALMAQSRMRASMGQGFAFDGISYKVTSFQFIFAPKKGEARVVKGNGATITSGMKQIISKARPGDRIIVDKIRAMGPGGKQTLLPMIIEVRR